MLHIIRQRGEGGGVIGSVIVIGAGIVGAACARSLARLGVEVTVIDRSTVASATTAGGEGNLLVSDKSPGPELVMALHAAARWPSLTAEDRKSTRLNSSHVR